jgi:hypothetical protein
MPEAAKSRLELLSDNLWADKSDLGRLVRARAKELFPDIVTPDEQAETAVAPLKGEVEDLKKQLTGALDRLAAREKAEADLKAEVDLGVKLTEARKAFGLTDAGYDKMIKRMQETGNVTDAMAAAAWVVSQMPKPEPSSSPSWMPEAMNLFGSNKREEQWEALHKDPRKYLDDQLREFVKDPDRYVAETFGQ